MNMKKFLIRVGAVLLVLILTITGIWLHQYRQRAETARQAQAQYDTTYITIDGTEYRRDIEVLDLSGTSFTDWDALAQLTRLTQLDLRDTGLTAAQYESLQAALPGCNILWSMQVGSSNYDNDTTALTLTDLTAEDIEVMHNLPALETVQLKNCSDTALLLEAMEALPHVQFLWDFEIYGIPVSTTTESLDLTGMTLSDTAELEAKLPYFYNLKKVDMCGCGLSNEEMDALNKRHMDTQFVWTVSIGPMTLRTDVTYFMPFKLGHEVTDSMCKNLRYCTDIVCMDLGHMSISNCDFVEYMPHLQYLILGDTGVSDLTAIGTLKELKYLELFLTKATDFWPLLGCTALEDLNICYTPFSGDCDPLYRMTWLDRLWMAANGLTLDQQTELKEALPGTHIIFRSPSSTNKGWRMSPNYYIQRDIFGMLYMTK